MRLDCYHVTYQGFCLLSNKVVEKVEKPATCNEMPATPPRIDRRETLRRLIAMSPYRKRLAVYEEDICRVAGCQQHVLEALDSLQRHWAGSRPDTFGQNTEARAAKQLVFDFLEFFHFSTPETQRYIANED